MKTLGLIGLLIAVFLLSAQQTDDVPVLTVCRVFDDLQALNGRVVVVIARVSISDEGAWATEDECQWHLTTNGYTWRPSILIGGPGVAPTVPKTFAAKKSFFAMKFSEEVKNPGLKPGDRLMALYGRLETRELTAVRNWGGGLVPNGYGHLNAAPAQLVQRQDGMIYLDSR